MSQAGVFLSSSSFRGPTVHTFAAGSEPPSSAVKWPASDTSTALSP